MARMKHTGPRRGRGRGRRPSNRGRGRGRRPLIRGRRRAGVARPSPARQQGPRPQLTAAQEQAFAAKVERRRVRRKLRKEADFKAHDRASRHARKKLRPKHGVWVHGHWRKPRGPKKHPIHLQHRRPPA